MKKHLLLLAVLLFVGSSLKAQQPFFSSEKSAFFDQLSAYLATANSKQDRDEAAVMMNSFGESWNSYFGSQEAALVMQLCEYFHTKSGSRAYPNIFNFIDVVHRIPFSGMAHQDVYNWLSYTDLKAKKSVSGMDKYLTSCRAIFSDKVLSAKGNSKWLLRDAKIGFPSKDEFLLSVNGSLVLASAKDESVLKQTQGIYRLEGNRWEGSGGRADWSRFGIDSERAYVVLPEHYTLDLNRSEYAIDSVVFNDKRYFKDDILGRFEDKVMVNTPDEKTMYPKVKSYRSDYVIPNILKNIDFEGGIGMMGNQVDVFGGVDNKAVFKFRQQGKERLRVEAKRFVMSAEELLVSDHIALRLYLPDTVSGGVEMDSLYHNDLGFRYDNAKRSMMIFRSEKDFGDAPFHDQYHGLDLFLEAMYWNVDDNLVDFRRMEGINPSSEGDVQSMNFFRMEDFKKLQGLDGKHPMLRIESFLKNYGNPEHPDLFLVGDLATYLQFPIEQVISLLLRLQSEGYVEYFKDTKSALVLPRFYDVIESYRDNIDYDVIKLHTVTSGRQPNLRLDLTNNELLVFGITTQIEGVNGTAISLSDRKHVVIVPDNGRLVFKKNRDFSFSGGILAGMFEFFTKDCLFSYEDFQIDMKQVDSLRFYAKADYQIFPVNGTLEKLQGRLMIDRSNNKSSRYETPEYPIFHSDAGGYKFYRRINGGVFNPGKMDSVPTPETLEGKFYYSLYPFVVDSLNDLTMKKVRFEGELVSAGIFPNIIEPLVVMDDHSLGFVHQIGKSESDTYPMFGDKGLFHQQVLLSENGFWGNGQLDYQTAAFKSERFMFYLDSVTAITNHFKLNPNDDGTGFPTATADALKLKWDVYKPELTTETVDNPICMYGDTYFMGKTILSPEGYSADGKLRFGQTEFDSDHFAFDARTFVADSADFRLYSADSASVAFSATNYRANVDFDSQKVQYDYLNNESNLDFPMNRFVCSLKEAEWDMATNSLHLYNPVETFGDYATATTHEELLAVHNNASKFISLVPEQDSLQFYSMSAEYDMTNYVIHAHDVKIIRVADAAVFPYMHDVDINTESKLEPVAGELLADTLNGFHLYKDAVVNIRSSKDYDAHGVWDYTNADGVSTPILVDTIRPLNGITHGFAHIVDTAGFKLNTQFGFQGRMTLKATQQYGYFDGRYALLAFEERQPEIVEEPIDSLIVAPDEMVDSTLLVEPVELPVVPMETVDTLKSLNHWFMSAAYINPNAIKIPIDMGHIRDEEAAMRNGLYYELSIDGGYFASFLAPQKSRVETDEVAETNGLLWFDADSLRFVVTDTTRYDTYLDLNSRGVVSGQGSYDLGFDVNLVDFVMHGNYTQFPNDSLTINGLNILNVPIFDDKVLEAIAEVYAGMEGTSIDLTQTPYLDYYRTENDEVKTEEMRKNIELEGYPKMETSDFYCNTIVIPDLKMVWNRQLRAFISVGKIGLGSFGNHVVNKYVDGYVMFDRRLGNISYYFQNDMFMTYINYNLGDGQLQVHATYGDINQRLYDAKEKSRTMKKGDKFFQYVAVPYESMLDFLSRLKYAGIE